jgi:flagellar protein FliO/FliZ
MDTVDPLRFIFAFLFVIGLIGLMAFILKRYGHRVMGRGWLPKEEGGRRQVVEVRWVDTKRRLALVRRDNVEHLLLLSDKGEQVIESGIKHDER